MIHFLYSRLHASRIARTTLMSIKESSESSRKPQAPPKIPPKTKALAFLQKLLDGFATVHEGLLHMCAYMLVQGASLADGSTQFNTDGRQVDTEWG